MKGNGVPFKPDRIVTIEPCHACDGQMRVVLDVGLNGNHTITCPQCGHEHYRIVKDGVVTEGRWASSGPVYLAAAVVGAWRCVKVWLG